MFKQISLVFSSRLIASVIQGCMVIWLARELSLNEFGLLMGLISFTTVLLSLVEFGLSNGMAPWYLSGDTESVAYALKISRGINLLATLPILVFTCFYSPNTAAGWGLALSITAYAFERQMETVSALAIAQNKSKILASAIVTRRLLTVCIFGLTSGLMVHPLLSFGVSYFLGSALSLLLVLPRGIHAPHFRISKFVNLITKSRHFYVANVANQVRELDVVFLGLFQGANMAAMYVSGQKMTSPFSLLATTLSQFYLTASGPKGVGWVRKSALKIATGSLVVLVILGAMWPVISTIYIELFSSRYHQALRPLFWLVLTVPLSVASGPLAGMLQGIGRERKVGNISGYIGLITLLAVFLLPFFCEPYVLALAMTLIALLKFGLLFAVSIGTTKTAQRR